MSGHLSKKRFSVGKSTGMTTRDRVISYNPSELLNAANTSIAVKKEFKNTGSSTAAKENISSNVQAQIAMLKKASA